jgi:small-conductance mechanosensitive channel
MRRFEVVNRRLFSVVGFSFLFAYILSFLFEGQVLYSLLEFYEAEASGYILAAIVGHFAGLFSCGYFVKSSKAAKHTILGSIGVCLIATIPFFFAPSTLWTLGLIVGGYVSGCAVASWGYFLKAFTPKNERIKTCADVLIYSNIIMIAVNVVAINLSSIIGLILSMFCLVTGMAFLWVLPPSTKNGWQEEPENKPRGGIKKPLMLLVLFVFIITINSGLMYQVINPAFSHLTGLVSWYWAVPYIIALAVMRKSAGEDKAFKDSICRHSHDYGGIHYLYAARANRA